MRIKLALPITSKPSDPECTVALLNETLTWQEEEEDIHYLHAASKGLQGRLCHDVWASVTMANDGRNRRPLLVSSSNGSPLTVSLFGNLTRILMGQ